MRMLRAPAASPFLRLVAALPLASALLLSSCSDAVGIFASLSQEKPIGTLATKDISNVSPSRVVAFKTSDGSDNFFMSSGSLYRRPLALAKDAWKPVAAPSGASRCVMIAAADRLYAAWLDDSYLSRGLQATSNATDWTPIGSATLASDATGLRDIVGLFTVNGTVFVSLKETSSPSGTTVVKYKLFYVSGNDVVACAFDTTGGTTYDDELVYDGGNPYVVGPITSMAYYNYAAADNYWFVCGSSLYHGTVPGQFSLVTETDAPKGLSLSSVSWAPALGRLVVTTASGVFSVSGTMTGSTPGLIYARRASDSGWEKSAASVLVTPASGGYANFTDAVEVNDKDGNPLLVASAASSLKYGDGKTQSNRAAAARGYGVLVPDADRAIDGHAASSTASVVSTWSNYETSLMNYAVNYLFYLPGKDRYGNSAMILFACTAGRGLWSNARYVDGSGAVTWEGWEKE